MPQAIGFALAWLASNAAAVLGASVAAQATIAAAAAGLGSIALGLGLTLAVSFLTAKPPVKPSDGQVESKDPLGPRRTSYGIVRMSGNVWFKAAIDRILYVGLAINHGRIGEIVTYHIDESIVDVDPVTSEVTTAAYDLNNDTFIFSHLGLATETVYADMLSDFGIPDMRGDGLFTILAEIRNPGSGEAFQQLFPSGLPLLRITFKATVCWDPRDSAQSRTDETTHTWSENLVVCWLNYLLNPDGYGIPWERIEPNLAEWKEAMDICDEQVDLKGGGTASRYRVAGTWLHTTPPKDVVKNFEIACDGRMWAKRDGTIGISVGKFKRPTVTLDDNDITGFSDLKNGVDPLFSIAGVRAQYMSPDHDYREHDAEPYPTGDVVAELSDERVLPMDLSWVPSHNQTRRLMKVSYNKQMAQWRGSITTLMSGIKAIDERWIRIKSKEVDDLDIIAEVSSFSINPADMTCQIEFISVTEDLYDFDAETEEGEPDGGTFEVDSLGHQFGTTFDPLVDGGASVGDTVLVCNSSTGALPAAPAGWTAISTVALTNGIAMRSLWRRIDGTETAATFNTTAGPINWVILKNAGTPTFLDIEAATQAAGGNKITDDKPSTPAPSLVLAYTVSLNDSENSLNVNIFNADFNDFDYDDFITNASPAISARLGLIHWTSQESPEDFSINKIASADYATALMTFNMQPGV